MAPKKKILYIVTQGAWGGAQRYVFDLVTKLGDDFEITLAVGEQDGATDLQDKIAKFPNIKVWQLKYLVRRISPLHDFLAVLELVQIYNRVDPDLVHLNSSKAGVVGSLANVLHSLLAARHHLKTIYTVHGWVFNEPLSKFAKEIYFWAEKISARWKNKIIVLSEEDKRVAVSKLNLPEDKISLIPLGIDNIKFLDKVDAKNYLEKVCGSKFGEVRLVGTVANLFRTKGLDILIAAVASLKEKIKDKVKFVIIGEGPEKDNLQNLIKNYGLINEVVLVGSVPNASEYLTGFDLFVLPSRKEGLPYTLLEALQAQIPIIATEVGGVPSLIKNKINGLLVRPENSKALAEILEYALADAGEMRNMAGRSLTHYDLSKMLQATADLYNVLS